MVTYLAASWRSVVALRDSKCVGSHDAQISVAAARPTTNVTVVEPSLPVASVDSRVRFAEQQKLGRRAQGVVSSA